MHIWVLSGYFLGTYEWPIMEGTEQVPRKYRESTAKVKGPLIRCGRDQCYV